MSYLKSLATSFVYIAFFLAVITFSPGLPPIAVFSEYSIKPPAKLIGVLVQNDRLNGAEILLGGELKGPESFDSYNGELYTGMHGGYVGKVVGEKIIPVVKFGKDCDGVWAEEKCGRPLGIKFNKQGQLYVADAYYGIFKVDIKTGKYQKVFDITQLIDGKVPMLANSIDIANNGDVYWTDSSTEFKLYNGILAMFSDPAGRLLRYNAATKQNEVLLKKLGFSNGLKLSDDESYVVIAETMKSTIVKYHLKGPKAGKSEILIDGLPGAPDNIHADGRGNYLVSLIVPADPEHPQLFQTLIPHPNIRKMIARLLTITKLPFKLLDDLYPNDIAKKVIHALGSFETFAFMYPRKVTVLRINGSGQVLDALHNSDEQISGISSAFIYNDYLWLGSPFNEYLARVPLKQAFASGEFLPKLKNQQSVTHESKAPDAQPKVAKPTTASTKPIKTTTTAIPTLNQGPQVPKRAKVEQDKPVSNAQREFEKKQHAQEIPKKVVGTAKQPKKMESTKEKNELPAPVKQSEATKPPKQAEKAKASKQREAAKPPKKAEPVKRTTKLTDEI